MTVLLDLHEPKQLEYYLNQSCEVKVGNYNMSSGSSLTYPDLTIINGGKTIGINRKQSSEWVAGLDAWEEQIGRELNGPIDSLISIVEGFITPVPSGVYCW